MHALPLWTWGGVAQVKECASRLVRLAKGSGITVFIVGHVTKSGTIAGPKVVEHMVDTVLYLEGDRFNSYRYGTPPSPQFICNRRSLLRYTVHPTFVIYSIPRLCCSTRPHPICTALQKKGALSQPPGSLH